MSGASSERTIAENFAPQGRRTVSKMDDRRREHLRQILDVDATPAVKAVICGLGPYGYIVAMQAALQVVPSENYIRT
jgi:3-dehydroquinate dehydratase